MGINGIPVNRKDDSDLVLKNMANKDKKTFDAFKSILKVAFNSELSFKEINDVLYNVNEFLYRKSLEQKIPTKK